MNTQKNEILEHLKKYGSITSKQAFILYGCTRLSARIYDFRKMGLTIFTIDRQGKTRYGTATRYAEYVLAPKDREGGEYNGYISN